MQQPLDIRPLAQKFAPTIAAFGVGLTKNIRFTSREIVNQPFEHSSSEYDLDGGKAKETSFAFADGSGWAFTTTKFPDGTYGISFTIIGSTENNMVALIDMAASGFAEMDSMALARGLGR